MRIFFLREIAEIKNKANEPNILSMLERKRGMERGSRKWKGKNAETKDEMFWAVGNRLLGSFLGRARGLACPGLLQRVTFKPTHNFLNR